MPNSMAFEPHLSVPLDVDESLSLPQCENGNIYSRFGK